MDYRDLQPGDIYEEGGKKYRVLSIDVREENGVEVINVRSEDVSG